MSFNGRILLCIIIFLFRVGFIQLFNEDHIYLQYFIYFYSFMFIYNFHIKVQYADG